MPIALKLGARRRSGQGSRVAAGPVFFGRSSDNGVPNGLRGRGALLERHGVQRLRMYSIELQVFLAETWQTVAIDDNDVVASSYLVNYTSVPGFCTEDTTLTCRVVHRDGIRWDDGRLGLRTTVSNQFQARAVVNTQVC